MRRPRVQHRRGPLGLQGRGIGLWVAGCALAAIGAAMVLGYRGPNKPSFEVTPGAQFHAAAAKGDDAAIAQLLALPDAERTGTDWLALAQGHEANGNPAEATDALQRALVVEPELAPVPEIRSLVWEIVATPPLAGERTAGAVVELTQKHLEEHAPDLLWAIADEDTLSGETQRAALNALQPLVEEASEAVQTALATRQAQSCQQLQELAERISEHGDVRTADVLTELERVQECPASGLCGQCITQNPSLVQAKSAAASRPLPHLDFK